MAHILDKAKKITLPWPNFGVLLVITYGLRGRQLYLHKQLYNYMQRAMERAI